MEDRHSIIILVLIFAFAFMAVRTIVKVETDQTVHAADYSAVRR